MESSKNDAAHVGSPMGSPKSRMDNTNKISAIELQRNAGIVHDSVFAWNCFFVKNNPFMSYNRKTPK